MATDEQVRTASLRRKLEALEASGGDPAKVAELRFQVPAERRSAPQVTVAETPAPAEPAKAPEPEKPAEAPKMAASRGIAKDEPKPAADKPATA